MKVATMLLAMAIAAAALAQEPGRRSPSEVRDLPTAQQPRGEPEPVATQPRGGIALMPVFESVDKNNDGALTRKEARGVSGLKFSDADTDDDASLDELEYSAAVARAALESRN
jgi:hypothetical protein